MPTQIDTAFIGSVPEIYEKYMVPMIFEPYALDIALRVSQLQPTRILEIAAGTGVVTRELAKRLPQNVALIATDLNPTMLEQAQKIGTSRPVEWLQADAMKLPFPNESFDVIVCQFGAMFFPNKAQAFSEVRRVLRPQGTFLFSVWDRLDQNEFAEIVTKSLATVFPDNPPSFMARIPHGYFEKTKITQDLRDGGFHNLPEIATLAFQSRVTSPGFAAMALCQGTPVLAEILERDPAAVSRATEKATDALSKKFGSGAIEGKIQAHVITVKK